MNGSDGMFRYKRGFTENSCHCIFKYCVIFVQKLSEFDEKRIMRKKQTGFGHAPSLIRISNCQAIVEFDVGHCEITCSNAFIVPT
jgi:hypothetical protein